MRSLVPLSLLIVLLLTNSCVSKRIKLSCGIGGTAQRGINYVQPMIDAMERYKADHGKYPTEDVKDFVPQYIDKIPTFNCTGSKLETSPTANVIQDKDLCRLTGGTEEDGQSFTVRFYPNDEHICLLSARNNICEYTSETKQWNCYSH